MENTLHIYGNNMNYDLAVIIPTYRNPKYLQLCLQSLANSISENTQVIVVVDGFVEESSEVIELVKFPHNNCYVMEQYQNEGMARAINIGVYATHAPNVLIVNDDNVFAADWEVKIREAMKKWDLDSFVYTINQIEPHPSIFTFPIVNCGTDADTFDQANFERANKIHSVNATDSKGGLFPFIVSKTNYMKVNGFDEYYQSPFWVDTDWWLKLQLLGVQFKRTFVTHLYHFGSRATKMGAEGERFRASEKMAAEQFAFKWGYVPNIIENRDKDNTKLPEQDVINGIRFR